VLPQWALLPFDPLHCTAESLASKFSGTPVVSHAEESADRWIAAFRLLPWDSEFFGLSMARLEPFIAPAAGGALTLEDGRKFVRQCLKACREAGAEHVSVQIHSSDTQSQLVLQQCGFFLADTIIEYRMKLEDKQLPAYSPQITTADQSHKSSLGEISGQCFSRRELNANRFNNDPVFENSRVRDMYALWAAKSVDKELADEVFVYCENGQALGFITVSLPTDVHPNVASIPLNAVDPAYHGRGIYTELVKAACSWLTTHNVRFVEIRTQLPNLGVHRAWSNLGGHMSLAFHTFHCPDLQLQTDRQGI
jgi:ribosomal protein S18 acetylase RimI-like enzyme